jgi:ATP-dependent protease ClpP protease subunit
MKEQGIFLRIEGEDKSTAVIEIHGEIGWDIWARRLKTMIGELGSSVKEVLFDIYSPGGSVQDGNWMVSMIADMPQHTVAQVQVAASMATVIALACDECEMAANGRWLIHNPWAIVMGDHAEFEKQAVHLRAEKEQLAEFYAKRTGKTVDEMNALMDEERWMMAKEAKEMGFVSAINDPFDIAAFAEMNAAIQAAGKWPAALVIGEKEEGTDEGTDDGGTEGAGEDGDSDAGESSDGDEGAEGDDADAGAGEGGGSHDSAAVMGAKLLESLETIKALQAKETELRAELARERDEMARKDAEHATALADKDTQLQDLAERILRLTPAMADGSEDGEHIVSTWEQALEECGKGPDGVAEAREKYPELYKEQREKDRAKRKGRK